MKPMPIPLEWALTSTLLILAVLALRGLLGKRVSAGLRYALWAVVLARLLVPVQLFPIFAPVVSASGPDAPRVTVTAPPSPASAPVLAMNGSAADSLPDGMKPYDDNAAPAHSVPASEPLPVRQLPGWVWLAGSLAMGLAFVLSNVSFARRLRRARMPLKGKGCPLPVYIAPGLPSPCLFGMIHPAVYVTPRAAEDSAMLRHVLAHEYTHFRHGDHIWNVLRSAALAAHWWNPLVWAAVALSRRDCELACDEGALKRLGEAERVAYGRTLLALLTESPRPHDLLTCATTMTGGQKSVWERVTRIARAQKRWLWAAVVLVLAAALACVCAFGAAKAEEETPGPGPEDAAGATPDGDSPEAEGGPGFTLDDLTADLTFSTQFDSGGGPYVRMEGAVGDVALIRGAAWSPENVWKEDASQELSMMYPAFGGLGQHVLAWWADEARSAVTVSTMMGAMLSSQFNVGYWEFTVDLGAGTVTAMDGLSFREGFPDEETHFYPESISDEEAVKAARVAAKLLTMGEDYYNENALAQAAPPAAFTPIELDPVYTLDDLGVSVRITGIHCTSAWWYPARENSYSGELMGAYLELWEARCLGESFRGAYNGVTARYDPDADPNLIWLSMYDLTAGKEVYCSVNLYTGAVTDHEIPGWETVSPVLSDGEMLAAAQALAELYQGAADYYAAASSLPVEEGPLPFDTAMKLWFGSGAGAWSTILTLHPDGSFEGHYSDSDLGVNGPDYDSTEYVCQFHGRFGDIAQATAASWSMTLEELVLDTGRPVGEEWIEPIEDSSYNRRYISSTPYGMDSGGEPLKPGAQFVFYTPDASGKRGGELYGMEHESSELYPFWIWWPERNAISEGSGGALGCYALRSVETGYGFFDLHAWGLI